MKLAKYLPLLTIASTAAIVTPLVTSCSKYIMYEITEDYKLVDPKQGSMTEENATQVYLDDASKNTKIIVDDFLNHFPTNWTEGTTIYIGARVNTKSKSVSIKFNEKLNFKVEGKKHSRETILELKDIPISIDWDTKITTPAWSINSEINDIETAKSNTKWQYFEHYWGYDPATKKHYDKTNKYNYKTNDEDLSYIVSWFSFSFNSHYLSQTQKA